MKIRGGLMKAFVISSRIFNISTVMLGGIRPIRRQLSLLQSAAASTMTPFTVLVEGNIGSGKTTFLKNFSQSDVCVLSEPVDLWRNLHGHNIFGMMYNEPSRWSLTFQSYVQLTMLDLHTRKTNLPFKLMERSIYSARYCFVENLVRNGTMSAIECIILDEWFQWVTANTNVGVDLIVYLRTTPDVIYERIRARGRAEEKDISLQFLRNLHKLHEDWLCGGSRFSCPAPVIVLDANLNIAQMRGEIERCKSIILQKDLVGVGNVVSSVSV